MTSSPLSSSFRDEFKRTKMIHHVLQNSVSKILEECYRHVKIIKLLASKALNDQTSKVTTKFKHIKRIFSILASTEFYNLNLKGKKAPF